MSPRDLLILNQIKSKKKRTSYYKIPKARLSHKLKEWT